MTLTTRIVAALVLAALIPMAVVVAVSLAQADKRAGEETASHLEDARAQAENLIEKELAKSRAAADCAASALAANRTALAAVLRGPESVARPAAVDLAVDLAGRCGLNQVDVSGASGATLATFESEGSTAALASLVERRAVPTDGETLTLVTTRWLGAPFAADVATLARGDARLGRRGAATCKQPFVEVAVAEDSTLCVSVKPGDAEAVRLDFLKSFAGVAPLAFLASLAVGVILAGRIARPVRELAERARSISAEHAGPITLLEEKSETRRMTLAFDQMLDALRASERRRLAAERVAAWEEIAKRLAHEIKNPLSPIQLAVENLRRTRERAPDAFDETFDVETRTILEEVGSLRALVDEFAQFARLPRPRVAACDPRGIVTQALSLYAGRIDSMRVVVRIEDASAPASIAVDAEQIGRILKNVVANALDAMEESREKTLSVTVRAEGGRVVFTVRDTGRGFDAETQRRVFEPYFTTRAGGGGTGLGMAIARRIAEEHGGSLSASGAPGAGATITLTLPLAGPAAADT